MNITTVQISKVTKATLDQMAKSDMRSITSEMEWLIQQEAARRASPVNAVATILESGEERTIPVVVTRDLKNGTITIQPVP
ncbi:MAG: hypothetical protein ABFD24_06025 [Anaerolineaceae bacterium]